MPASQAVPVARESAPSFDHHHTDDNTAEPSAQPAARSSLQARLAAMRAIEACAGPDDASPMYQPPATVWLRPPPPVTLKHADEADLLAILTAPLLPGESALCGHQRREHQLAAILATLSVGEARTLHQRLSRPPSATDTLASKFAALILDRRCRLLAFIADTRRRAAIARARSR